MSSVPRPFNSTCTHSPGLTEARDSVTSQLSTVWDAPETYSSNFNLCTELTSPHLWLSILLHCVCTLHPGLPRNSAAIPIFPLQPRHIFFRNKNNSTQWRYMCFFKCSYIGRYVPSIFSPYVAKCITNISEQFLSIAQHRRGCNLSILSYILAGHVFSKQ